MSGITEQIDIKHEEEQSTRPTIIKTVTN